MFLDDGGVLNDNARRAPQWQRLVGAFFVPLLGGTAQAWAEANRVCTAQLWGQAYEALRAAHPRVAAFVRASRILWLNLMCDHLGMPCPAEGDALRIAVRAQRDITRRIRAAVPGAIEAVCRLRAGGTVLHTASGEPSDELEGYLEGMAIRDCFGTLYGPDIVDEWKDGPGYYAAVFGHAGVDAADAVVVDDSPRQVRLARDAGATAVLVTALSGAEPVCGVHTIATMAELPALLERLVSG